MALGLAVISFLLGPSVMGVLGHAPGSDSLHAEDEVTLSPAGSEEDRILLSLSSLGLPVDHGDTLEFSWEVNEGSGPAVLFEIQDHTADPMVLFTSTAASGSSALTFSETGRYMVFLQNPNDSTLQVAYELELLPPPTDPGFSPLDYAILGTLAFASVLLALLIWRGRKTQAQERDSKSETPSDR